LGAAALVTILVIVRVGHHGITTLALATFHLAATFVLVFIWSGGAATFAFS
jgi:hypothetical protein